MPQSSAISVTVIFVNGFFNSRFLSDCSNARLVTCDILAPPVFILWIHMPFS